MDGHRTKEGPAKEQAESVSLLTVVLTILRLLDSGPLDKPSLERAVGKECGPLAKRHLLEALRGLLDGKYVKEEEGIWTVTGKGIV